MVKITGVDPPYLQNIQNIKCHIGASPSLLENPIIKILIKHLCNLPWQRVGFVGCLPVLHGRGCYFHIKPSPVCSCFCVKRWEAEYSGGLVFVHDKIRFDQLLLPSSWGDSIWLHAEGLRLR